MKSLTSWMFALSLLASAAPAFAQVGGDPPPGGGSNKGAPGPIAGAGLPFLLLAGGYVLVRRYRNRSKAD